MTMSETKTEQNAWQYAPWVAVAILGYMLWNKPATPVVDPVVPVPVVSIEKDTKAILQTMRVENARIFNQAADEIEKGTLKTDKELFDFVRPATEKARKEANRPFDVALDLSLPRNDDGSFAGKEKEAASLLRKIAKSW
jgi:hypothetical protein